jgi:hypothetical protein
LELENEMNWIGTSLVGFISLCLHGRLIASNLISTETLIPKQQLEEHLLWVLDNSTFIIPLNLSSQEYCSRIISQFVLLGQIVQRGNYLFLCINRTIQQFLAADFLSSSYADSILKGLSRQNRSVIQFKWKDPIIMTSALWDPVIYICGMKGGVMWLSEKLLTAPITDYIKSVSVRGFDQQDLVGSINLLQI